MKKLVVDKERCISCGACVQIDEEHFKFSDAGTSEAISQENLESEALNTAMGSCPVDAIKIVENENCNCGDDCQCGDDCKCNHE